MQRKQCLFQAFKDMQYERDAIREITAPILNAEKRKRCDEYAFCDRARASTLSRWRTTPTPVRFWS